MQTAKLQSAHLWEEFPKLVSYNHIVELQKRAILPLCFYLKFLYGACTGLSFIDSSRLEVCDPHHAHCHKVFQMLARWGKPRCFFFFKIHLVVNDRGELLGVMLTTCNTDDRTSVPQLANRLWGKLFGDKGYISQELFERLFSEDLQLITKIKNNMENKLMTMFDKLMLRKRALIESVTDQPKNISQIVHSRHRNVLNFLVNLPTGLNAYSIQPKKPSLDLTGQVLTGLPTII